MQERICCPPLQRGCQPGVHLLCEPDLCWRCKFDDICIHSTALCLVCVLLLSRVSHAPTHRRSSMSSTARPARAHARTPRAPPCPQPASLPACRPPHPLPLLPQRQPTARSRSAAASSSSSCKVFTVFVCSQHTNLLLPQDPHCLFPAPCRRHHRHRGMFETGLFRICLDINSYLVHTGLLQAPSLCQSLPALRHLHCAGVSHQGHAALSTLWLSSGLFVWLSQSVSQSQTLTEAKSGWHKHKTKAETMDDFVSKDVGDSSSH